MCAKRALVRAPIARALPLPQAMDLWRHPPPSRRLLRAVTPTRFKSQNPSSPPKSTVSTLRCGEPGRSNWWRSAAATALNFIGAIVPSPAPCITKLRSLARGGSVARAVGKRPDVTNGIFRGLATDLSGACGVGHDAPAYPRRSFLPRCIGVPVNLGLCNCCSLFALCMCVRP